MNRRWWLGAVFAALIAFGGLPGCLGTSSTSGKSRTRTPTWSPYPVATATPAPTNTFTVTSVFTNTRTSTRTNTPPWTATPTVSPTIACSTVNHTTLSSCGSFNHSLTPSSGVQNWYDSFAYNADIYFYFYGYAGYTYHFSLCQYGGYMASNCGDFHLYDASCTSVASWVNCGAQYELSYYAPSTGAYYLQIHNGVCGGTAPTCFNMAYWYN